MSAHPKVDPRTNELVYFEYGLRAPFLSYGVVSAEGSVVHTAAVPTPGARLPHDMAITQNHSILMDLPVIVDMEALKERKWRTFFDKGTPSRFAIIPRHGRTEDVRWFEADPCYIYHTANAWESADGNTITLIACRVDDPLPRPRPEDGAHAAAMANLRVVAKLPRWTFDLVTGTTKEEILVDTNTEFPSIDARRLGVRTRHAWNTVMDVATTARFSGIAHFETDTGAQKRLEYGPGRFGSETPFAPREGATAEGDGYLISFVHDDREGQSEVWIVDALAVQRGPVCRLPRLADVLVATRRLRLHIARPQWLARPTPRPRHGIRRRRHDHRARASVTIDAELEESSAGGCIDQARHTRARAGPGTLPRRSWAMNPGPRS